MAKKDKKAEVKRVPTKRQLSKWQRERKIHRIIIIAAAVFLVGIIGYLGAGYYNSEVKPLHEEVIKVNDASFTMSYYVKMLGIYSKSMSPSSYMANLVANQIIRDELIRQGAGNLGVSVSEEEISQMIKQSKLPNEEVYRNTIEVSLLGDALLEGYFSLGLEDKIEQAHIQVMLVESEDKANETISRIEGGENFTALVDKFSCYPQIEGELGWLPEGLMPNPLLANVTAALEPGELSQPIYDESISKNIGYWLIKVTDKDEEKGIKAMAMLLGSEQEAKGIKAMLNSGKDFATLAKEYSQHESKSKGGELNWVKRGDMNSVAFDEVAFNLTLGEISEPVKDKSVQTKGGYWVVQLLDKGRHEPSEEVKQNLANKRFGEWLNDLEKKSTINNYLDEEKISWALNKVGKGG